jgi:hypothetical protein
MNIEKINFLFKSCDWDSLFHLYTPIQIVKSLSFKDSLYTAYRLLYNDSWDEDIQDFAIKLFNEIRTHYSEAWNKSWEYEALLGLTYHITYRQDERYIAYKKAFEMVSHPPARLLIELARCCICPGPPPISYDDAIELIMEALKEAPYMDGIGLLCEIYSTKNNQEKENYWSEILKKSDKKIVSPIIEPRFLVDKYLKEIGK